MPNTIPFIHNYCDRWCERCGFTQNCALNLQLKALEATGINMELEETSSSFKKSVALLEATARMDGVKVEALTDREAELIECDMTRKTYEIMKKPLILLCRNYIMAAHKLLSNNKYWKKKAKRVIQKLRSGVIAEADARMIAEEMNECQQVIAWYIFQIEIKFARAFSGKTVGEEPPLQSDVNGSAKVALHAVERSMNALKHLLKLTNDEDVYLPLLAALSKIDAAGRKEFPNAPLFIRPGFDEQ
jgi:hypothetical protein